jgi:hypothetical protein
MAQLGTKTVSSFPATLVIVVSVARLRDAAEVYTATIADYSFLDQHALTIYF